VRPCHLCGNLDSQDPCGICTDPVREQSSICVVEGVGDLWALERAAAHQGLYHVLGGTLSPMTGTGPEDLNLRPLQERIEAGGVTEIILALGATVEGATTAHWLSDRLQQPGLVITRVAQGVPIGGAIDLLDDGTLGAALRARRPLG
jgi:recombination protein RecR